MVDTHTPTACSLAYVVFLFADHGASKVELRVEDIVRQQRPDVAEREAYNKTQRGGRTKLRKQAPPSPKKKQPPARRCPFFFDSPLCSTKKRDYFFLLRTDAALLGRLSSPLACAALVCCALFTICTTGCTPY